MAKGGEKKDPSLALVDAIVVIYHLADRLELPLEDATRVYQKVTHELTKPPAH